MDSKLKRRKSERRDDSGKWIYEGDTVEHDLNLGLSNPCEVIYLDGEFGLKDSYGRKHILSGPLSIKVL